MGSYYWGFVLALALFSILALMKEKNKKNATDAVPVKATVVRIMPGENNAQVLFEKENGDKINLSVPLSECIFVEGDTGWLKEAENDFGSFTQEETPHTSQKNETSEGKGEEEIIEKAFYM